MAALRVPLLSLLFCTFAVSAQVACSLPDLQALSSDHPERLFFTGTKYFRDKEYAKALVSWRRLTELPDLPADQEHLRTDAQNNLGFLHYMGWGTPSMRATALDYWRTAYKAGHEESAYHLCHYFGDAREPEYQPPLAEGYCREALRRYSNLREQDGQTSEVVAQVRRILTRLAER